MFELSFTVVSRLTLRPETGYVELSYSLLLSRGLRFDRRLAMFELYGCLAAYASTGDWLS